MNSNLITLLKQILIILSFICFIIIHHYSKLYKYLNFEIVLFFYLSLITLFFLTSSFDLISIYLCLELQSLLFYLLASVRKKYIYSIEAGFKYFILDHFHPL